MTKRPESQSHFLILLTMLTGVIGVTAGELLHFTVHLGPLTLNGGSFMTPIFFFCLDIIAEVYGYAVSKKVIWAYCVCAIVHVTVVSLILRFPSPLNKQYIDSYSWVFGTAMFGFLFATLGIVVGLFINARYLTKWKLLSQGKYFWLRSIGSTAIGEFVQLGIFSIVAIFLYPSLEVLIKMLISIYILRIFFALILAFPGTIITNILKNVEQIDAFDYNPKFNPFKKT